MKKIPVIRCVCILFAVLLLWQNLGIQVDEQELCFSDLPTNGELRIVQISDLHGREFGKENKRLLKRVSQAEPDLICITGDLFGSEEEARILPELLEDLCELAPVYYVTGNHEWQVEDLQGYLEEMEDLGVHVLRDAYEVLQWQGKHLILAGIDDPCGPLERKGAQALMEQIRREQGQEAFVILLSHRNDVISFCAEQDIALTLSGHCHGGVVRLPVVGGVFGPQRTLFPDYDSGLYLRENSQLYVSRGLGYSRMKLRVFNPPHLPVLVLKGK
ncbi:MAG: metallophosphoesterase [Oscillospiraceae bacterium]|nr:metallophosphoesterase [Oscillospiraceae bacterium]